MFNFSKKFKSRWLPDIEPHEVLLDKLAKKKEVELGISEKKFEVPILKRIIWGFFVFSILIFFIFFLRTFQLQVIKGENFLLQAQENKFIISKIQAERGVIYDKNLNQLVFNHPTFDLICQKNDLPEQKEEKEKILNEISQILKIDLKEIEKKISEGRKSEDSTILISENLDYQTLIILETKIGELPGFQIVQNSLRQYVDGENFSHLIGYTGKIKKEELEAEPEFYSILDYVGREGLEKIYEKILRKNPGLIRIERDAKGNLISKEIVSLPESGNSLVLWIDSDLQKKIEEELKKKLLEIGAKKAAAVALDPKTGGVLALLSLPPFNNNIFSKGISQEEWEKIGNDPLKPLFDRAISGQYPMGSTIKPLIASAVLEEKIISPEKKINDDKGYITIPNPWNPAQPTIKKDWAIHGLTDLRKAIAESCNVYFYTVGGGYGEQEGLGPTKIKKYLELFGWGKKTNVDLPAEADGLIPDPLWKKSYFEKKEDQVWRDGDTYNLSIGQGYITATPIQVATAFLTIANGGKLLQPQIVQKIVDAQKNVIETIEPKIIRELNIDQKNLQIVREGMRQAVTGQNSPHASAVILNSLPVKVAAKTGTAEVIKKGEKFYNTWITVFAPYSELPSEAQTGRPAEGRNRPYEDPKIVLTLMIEDISQKELENRLTVLPVAKSVLEWYFSR